MDWIVNTDKHGGAQAELLSSLKPEPAVYLVIDMNQGRRYGVIEDMPKLLELISKNVHAYEIIPTDRRRKVYLEYDIVQPNNGESAAHCDAQLQLLQAKAVADAEMICGPGIAALSGGWGEYKNNTIKYSIHIVRPDRYFANHAAALAMPAIAASVGADPNVYSRNQLFKFPGQSKKGDSRLQRLITGDLSQHILTAAFEEGATELKLDIPVPLVARAAPRARKPAGEQKSCGLGPWKDQNMPIPDNWAMTSPPLETLRLIRHSTERPHRIPRKLRHAIMCWAQHKGITLHEWFAWVF